ncbi:MAG: regulatory iron-sulfur-containing complex subunit RicT [Bacteroidota bacterium]
MGCKGCNNGKDGGGGCGCGSSGKCGTSSCNRLNTFDWLSIMEVDDVEHFDIAEVSFKNGARKGFFRNPAYTKTGTGDMVVVETGTGHDMGRITLSGELVRLQMRKKRVPEDSVLHGIIRRANERDLERLQEARALEKPTMVRARVIARTLGLEMKVGDVEYQGDRRKATFYYTADGRVDFRELIRHFAKEFRVKIEMRQIGARQESARVGGLGSCGRELCCSTWLTDFKSVSTAAARYQNLAINQSKLSGQCGRLKCCLNYELDTYLDALDHFPKRADKLETQVGRATLIKTDIFKKIMYYVYEKEGARGKFFALSVARVHEIQAMNKSGEKPIDLIDITQLETTEAAEIIDYADVTGVIELPPEEKRKKKRWKRKPKKKPAGQKQQHNQSKPKPQQAKAPSKQQPKQSGGTAPQKEGTPTGEKPQNNSNNNRRRNNKKRRKGRNNRNTPPKTDT